MGKSRSARSFGRQPRGGKKKRAKREAKRGARNNTCMLADCLANRVTGAGPENHMRLYDAIRGPTHPRLSIEYFYAAHVANGAIDQAPYIIPEMEKEVVAEEKRPPSALGGGPQGEGEGEGEEKGGSSNKTGSFPLQPPKKDKGKDKKRTKVHFHESTKDNEPKDSMAQVRTSFGSATIADGEDVPDRILESVTKDGSQYSYPAVETVNRGTVKRMMAKARTGREITEEDEYCVDPSTPLQQQDIDRCLDDLFASEKQNHKMIHPEEEDEETIRIIGPKDDSTTNCLSRGYSTLRTLHPRYADWLLTDLHNLGFHQFFDWVQAMVNTIPIQNRVAYTLADLFWSCENKGGVPWKFSYSNATKIDTIKVPCRLFSLRVRFNTYTEREQELRIEMAAVEEELLQKKSDLSDVTQDYLTCLVHLGIPGNISDAEAEAIESMDDAREHFAFPVVIINAQFEMLLG